MCSTSSNEYKQRNFDLHIDYNELIKLIDSVKMYSGCDEVKLVGNNKTFEELIASGFPLGEFKCENMDDMLDETRLWVIPIDGNKKVKIYG